MNSALEISIRGVGVFLQGAPDWPTLQGVLCGERGLLVDAPVKPAARVLPPAARRRAPEGVRLAAEVAAQACKMAGYDPATLPCVFASTHGDVAITDAICTSLATAPRELSPTRFHNSVLNAPAGYWTIATGCTAASSAVTACYRSLAAGLLEAAVLTHTEAAPVLFACFDVASAGPLAEMTHTRLPFGVALVLAPEAAGVHVRLDLHADTTATPIPKAPVALRALVRDNPTNAQALALLAAIVGAATHGVRLPLSTGTVLELEFPA